MIDGWDVIVTQWVLAGLALGFVLLRVYARVAKADSKHTLGDFIIVAAWMMYVVSCALYTALWKLGVLGETQSVVTDLTTLTAVIQNTTALKIMYAAALVYITDLWLVKAAILTFYYIITPKELPKYRFVLKYISCFTFLTYLAVLGCNAFWCIPVQRNWSLNSASFCPAMANLPVFFLTVCCHILSDLMILCFPFPLLRHSHLARHGMYGVIAVFTLGTVSVAASLLRICLIVSTPTMAAVGRWTALESATGIMVACAPALRILLVPGRAPSPPPPGTMGRANTIGSRPTRPPRVPTLALDASGIWDGTLKTAPAWAAKAAGASPVASPLFGRGSVRFFGSVSFGESAPGVSPVSPGTGEKNWAAAHEIELGAMDAEAARASHGSSGSPRTNVLRALRHMAGGIVVHPPFARASVRASIASAGAWMELPDPPFLCAHQAAADLPRRGRDITSMFVDDYMYAGGGGAGGGQLSPLPPAVPRSSFASGSGGGGPGSVPAHDRSESPRSDATSVPTVDGHFVYL